MWTAATQTNRNSHGLKVGKVQPILENLAEDGISKSTEKSGSVCTWAWDGVTAVSLSDRRGEPQVVAGWAGQLALPRCPRGRVQPAQGTGTGNRR
jgi:hypothetical protein